MRVMVFVKATADSERGAPPAPGMMEAMGRFNAELHKAGILLMAEGLKPTAQAKRVAFDGPGRTVIDGPFAEARELVAGFWLWEVKDMEEALAWVKRCPNPMPGPSEIEIRPLFDMADIEALLPPDILALGPTRTERWEAVHANSAAGADAAALEGLGKGPGASRAWLAQLCARSPPRRANRRRGNHDPSGQAGADAKSASAIAWVTCL